MLESTSVDRIALITGGYRSVVVRHPTDIVAEEGMNRTPLRFTRKTRLQHKIASPAVHRYALCFLGDVSLLPPDIEAHVLLISDEVRALCVLCQVQTFDNTAASVHIEDVMFIRQTEVGIVWGIACVSDL